MSAPEESLSPEASVPELVEAERVAMLYRLAPRTLLTAFFFSFAVYLVFRPVTPAAILIPWLIVNNAITLARYLKILAYRRAQPPVHDAELWFNRFILLTFAAGIVWGLMGTLLLPLGRLEYQALVTLLLVGTAAVGLFTLGSSNLAYLCMAVPALLPPALFMIVVGDAASSLHGWALLAFLVLVVINARLGERNLTELLTLRFENARIAREKEAALVEARAAGQAKLQFLANMSHEIRTPLNGILGMTQLLRDSPVDDLQAHRLDTVHSSGEHLLVLINDVLDFSKISAGKLDIDRKPFDLCRAVYEVTDLLVPRAEARGLRLSVKLANDVPAWVMGDAGRLKQVLGNLVANAIKFTDEGSVQVNVLLEPANEQGLRNRLHFEITDTGVGIAEPDQARLFEPFRQVDASATRRHGGTGLGLAISRQLVELMGGAIGVRSQRYQGSTFWFTVAFAPCSVPEPVAAAAAQKPARPKLSGRVLLVEDNVVNREIVQAMLAARGIHVQCADDGREAVERATTDTFDLILMDCQLPLLDGYQATERIRAHESHAGTSRVPIVALTANAVLGDRERCLAADMDDYLAKPFRQEQLIAAIERWLPAARP